MGIGKKKTKKKIRKKIKKTKKNGRKINFFFFGMTLTNES